MLALEMCLLTYLNPEMDWIMRWMDYFDDMDKESSLRGPVSRQYIVVGQLTWEQITNCDPLENLASHTFQSSMEQLVQICNFYSVQNFLRLLDPDLLFVLCLGYFILPSQMSSCIITCYINRNIGPFLFHTCQIWDFR